MKLQKLFLTIISFFICASIFAQVPTLIDYQGKITNSAGAPLNGSYSITFSIHGDSADSRPGKCRVCGSTGAARGIRSFSQRAGRHFPARNAHRHAYPTDRTRRRCH